MKVRKVRCPSCAAPKVTPSASAYVYCDYCAQFMDWDLQAAKYNGKVMAGPRYRALCAELAPELDAARAAGDRDRLAAAHRTIFDQYIQDCANSYSPRIKDPAYREAILSRSVFAQVTTELDPTCKAAMAALDASIKGLEWDIRGEYKYDENYQMIAQPETKAKPGPFWRMYEAYVANADASKAALEASPHVSPDPDDTPPALSAKMRDSGFVQAWIAMLDADTERELLARSHLRDEYEDVPDPTMHDAACSACGLALRAPEGARQTVCGGCGQRAQLGTAGFCGQCGAPMTFGYRAKLAHCAHCKAELRLMTE